MPASRSFLTAFLSVLVLPVLLVTSRPGFAAAPSPSATPLPGVQSAWQQVTFTVDAVAVTATTRFLPSTRFVLPKSGDLTQTASSSTLSPFSELSLTAIPYGTKPSTESLPQASQGAVAQYRAQLQTVRRQEGAQIFPGPVATLFGMPTMSQMVVSNADLAGGVSEPLVAIEWVAEAGGRLWIARAAASVDEAQESTFASAVSALRVDSADVGHATTVLAPGRGAGPAASPSSSPSAATAAAPTQSNPSPSPSAAPSPKPSADPKTAPSPTPSSLPTPTAGPSAMSSATPPAIAPPTSTPTPMPAATPTPSGTGGALSAAPAWWSGDCDYNRYLAASGTGSFRLGSTYLGLPACGARPLSAGSDVLVDFYSGAAGQYEWSSVELPMRYLYQAFGVAPFEANANQIVAAYEQGGMQKIANGTRGVPPRAGDVLTYGPATTYGHTSIVKSTNLDGSGNGTITVVEEDNSPGGSSTLTVSGWTVQAFEPVTGWLHRI